MYENRFQNFLHMSSFNIYMDSSIIDNLVTMTPPTFVWIKNMANMYHCRRSRPRADVAIFRKLLTEMKRKWMKGGQPISPPLRFTTFHYQALHKTNVSPSHANQSTWVSLSNLALYHKDRNIWFSLCTPHYWFL